LPIIKGPAAALMRRLLFFILLLPVKTFAQEWVDYYHDSTLIVSMPYYYFEFAQNGLPAASANVEDALVVVHHVPDIPSAPFNLSDTSQLKEAYSIWAHNISKVRNAKFIRFKTFNKDGLKWVEFVCRGSMHGVNQESYDICVFVNDGMYGISFFEMGPPTAEKKAARQKIFSSARIAREMSRKQVSSKIYHVPFWKKLNTTGKVTLGVALALLIAFLIFVFKGRNFPQRIFAAKIKGKNTIDR
jgi:hypothetical protein